MQAIEREIIRRFPDWFDGPKGRIGKALVRGYGGLGVFGAFMGVLAWAVSPALAAWMAPVVIGMMLSIPVVALTSSRGPGSWLRRLKLMDIPEERDPPQVLVRAAQLRREALAKPPLY